MANQSARFKKGKKADRPKVGRPTSYSPELGLFIRESLADGKSLRSVCAVAGQLGRLQLFGVERDPWQVEALEIFPHRQRLCRSRPPMALRGRFLWRMMIALRRRRMWASAARNALVAEAWPIWKFLNGSYNRTSR
jgi:hypothetical protein